ncbi:LuxR C-terminal-related transcriptional regulator [Micromonospora chersina]|uniref:LuxR C-terminal-related transcriptional regulator n=1 Tax=Micromonospora chersina TaxID=47854 RepID=UPI00371B9E33
MALSRRPVCIGGSVWNSAERLVISPLTAEAHVNRAMIKLHCRDRAQRVVWAHESGLVAPRRR